MAPASKTASPAEAGASARRKTAFLAPMTVPAEGTGASTTLAARLRVAASSPVVAIERLRRRSGMVVNPAHALAFPAGRLWRSFGTVVVTARDFASIEPVAVVKRPALRIISAVVVDRIMVVPIAPPVMPAPSVATIEADAEPNSEEE